jgi:hypothetical protein
VLRRREGELHDAANNEDSKTAFEPEQSMSMIWKDTGKVVLNFSEPAKEIGPIPLVKGGHVKAPQNLRYTTHQKLGAAKSLEDLW